MKEIDVFKRLMRQKNKFSIRSQLTVLIGAVVLVSIGIAGGLAFLLQMIFPAVTRVPLFIQVGVLSFGIAVLAARFVTKIFSDPIQQLREGMREVADGNFDIKLETKSSAGEIKELFAGFNMMTDELQSTEILQTSFVSNVSHEFKTPINAIEGYTTLLQNTDNIDEIENEYIEKILFNTRRLSSLVSNILLLSKLENQSIQTHKGHYRLDEQIREAIVGSEGLWSAKGIDFDVELEDTVYYGNENLMHHVWNNLLTNAIKFSPENGKITIRLTKEDRRIVFCIEDEGIGISEEAKKRIFDKFYQEDTSHKGEGNGLGLPLVKRILTITDGNIEVENRAEGGCRFTVTLKGI